MTFSDPNAPPHPYISPPFSGGGGAHWPPFWNPNEPHHQPDLMPQFDRPHQFKKPRLSETPQNFSPFPPPNPRINPPSNKGTSHIFFKTRICAKFKEGTCGSSENCSFAHGEEDLREPPPNWQHLIREKERGNGGGSGNNWGDDQRMIHRMKICKKYYNGEECPYGEKCNFLHERGPPSLEKLKVDVPGQRESSAISIGVTGDGKGAGAGGDVDQTAVFWKTRICGKWEMGQCPFGERCHYAHGQSELRFSGSGDEPEVATSGGPVPRKTAPVSAFTPPTPNPVPGAPVAGDVEEKMKSKWKLTKKINRIYADWLDDRSPPHSSPVKEEM